MKLRLPLIGLMLLSVILMFQCTQDKKYEGLIDSLMYTRPAQFEPILKDIEKYELQIIYTQINRDSLQNPSFKTYRFGVDSSQYFYPASTIKLPTALIALEKLNQLDIEGVDKYTFLGVDSARKPQKALWEDSTAASGKPSLAHLVKKNFIVSDNSAYSRLYEFVGQEYLNKILKEKGYDTRIVQRFSAGFDAASNRYTNPFIFYKGEDTLYRQEEQYNPNPITLPVGSIQKGKGYIDGEENLVNQAKDFSEANWIQLSTMQEILKAVIFPEAVTPEKRFVLSKEDEQFLYQVMSEFPRESQFPEYDEKDYPDSFGKFLILGDSKKRGASRIRSFNKVGMAYGYLIDNAYIIDTLHGIEFFLSVVIYVNENQIFNDDIYQYKEIGFPFLKNLGQLFYEYERQRDRKVKPDLSKFQVTYN